MPRSLLEPYAPAPTPAPVFTAEGYNNLIRYIDTELHRLEASLNASPVALTVTDSQAVNVTTILTWIPQFPVTVDPAWDVPGGSWENPGLSQYTIPQAGLYQVLDQIEVSPFGIGNKNYFAGIRITITHANGDPDSFFTARNGGVDNIPLGVSLSVGLPFLQGDILLFEIAVVHETFASTVDVSSLLSLLRVSN